MPSLPAVLSLIDDLNDLQVAALPFYYNRWPSTWNQLLREDKEHAPVTTIGKDGFQVCMDVTQFKPNELTVKVVNDNSVVVEGKHEERQDDHGYISRHFVRRYALPKGYEADKLVSTLSSDGVLTLSVPKPALEDKSNERVVQIQQTGPAHLNVKENPEENKVVESNKNAKN